MLRRPLPTALLLLLVGCAPEATPPTPEPGWQVPAEYVEPGRVQVGTFNIAWLWDHYGGEYYPRNEVDFAMVASLIEGHDLDLVALQEINGDAALDLLALPERYSYVAGTTGWSQNPAILWRNDLLRVDGFRQVALPSSAFPSKDLFVADVESIEGDLAFTFVVVHLPPFDDSDSAEYRSILAAELRDWFEQEFGQGGAVVAAGDFNDTFEGIHPGWPSLRVLEDDPALTFASRDTEDYTELGYHSKIDHIVLNTPLLPRYLGAGEPDGCRVIAHDRLEPWASYEGGLGGEQNVSNHRPVWIYLELDAPED